MAAIIEPNDWHQGDRLRALVFLKVRQLIFEEQARAFDGLPRRKTDIKVEVVEAVIAAAAVAIGWRDDDQGTWQSAANLLREIADEMEASGFRSVAWGPVPAFDPTPVTFPAKLTRTSSSFELSFPDFPDLVVCGGPDDDADEAAQVRLDETVAMRLIAGGDIPETRGARSGEVDVALSADIGEHVLRFRSYGRRPKSIRRCSASG